MPEPADDPDALATAVLGLDRLLGGLPPATSLAVIGALEVGGALLIYVTLSLRVARPRRRDQ
jgi:hypothetical protein